MRFAVDIPNFSGRGEQRGFGDPRFVAELAYEAEAAGWDAFFVWDHIGTNWPVAIADPWVLLAACAMRTSSIKLGPMVTPLPRRRPWKLARETATLDQLSEGRLIFGVGIGGAPEYECYGESGDSPTHGAMLDEGLQILRGLWSGQPFSFAGAHYQIDNAHFLPRPVQTQIPIWVAGVWPNKKPFRRAAQWQGVFPIGKGMNETEQLAPAQMREVIEYVTASAPDQALPADYDIIHYGLTDGRDPAADRALVEAYAATGVNWWVENLSNDRGSAEQLRARIRQGPPR